MVNLIENAATDRMDKLIVDTIIKVDLALRAKDLGFVHAERVNFGETGLSITLKSDKHLSKTDKDKVGSIAADALQVGEMVRIYRNTIGSSAHFVQSFYTTHKSYGRILTTQLSNRHQSTEPHR